MQDLENMKICLLAGTLAQGGAERQLFFIAKALQESGARVRLLTLTRGEYWEEQIRQLGVPVVWVGERAGRLRRLALICAELRKDPPHIVQSQHFYTNLYAAGAARALGIREVGAVRSDVFNEVRSNGRILGRLSLRLPRTVAANSTAAISNAIANGVAPHRLHLLPNVVDIDHFSPSERPHSSTVRILAVGRMSEAKRFDRLLRLMAEVRGRTLHKVKAVLVGAGPLLASLQQQAKGLGLTAEEVEFHGAAEDPAPAYRDADIFMMTSDYEGTPNVVLEAMACGLAVIATRVGGVPELVEHGASGFLVEAGRIDRLLEATLALIENPGKRQDFGSRGRALVKARHSPGQLPKILTQIYQAALA